MQLKVPGLLQAFEESANGMG